MLRKFIILTFAGFLIACAGKKAKVATSGSGNPATPSQASGQGTKPATPPVQGSAPEAAKVESGVEPFYEGSEVSAKEGAAEEVEEEKKEVPVQVIGSEVEEEISKSMKGDVPQFDIPIVVNRQVENWMNYFQTRGRKFFEQWLARSERYIPMMRKILRENGLPEDIVYLAMIESGFKSFAYSRAKASGQWQFIKSTGRLYGLRTDFWIDERRDPEKSTIAAAQHLKDLYDRFNSWPLAFAGYNAGERKISNAIRRYSTEDFWEMSTSRNRYLRRETKDYVPKMLAAALIAKTPERYGFTDIQYEPPLDYEKVTCPQPLEISKIASALQVDLQLLQDLNSELLRGVTPPEMPNYELKVPRGYQEKFQREYENIRSASAVTVTRHMVRRGETLASIARSYGVDAEALRTFNRVKSTRLKSGQQIAIPFYVKTRSVALAPLPPEKGLKPSTYRVRSGDTLWSISRRFGVTVSELRKWNEVDHAGEIRPGQKLRLYAREDPTFIGSKEGSEPPAAESVIPPLVAAPAPPQKLASDGWKTYEVQEGDNLWDISKKLNVRTSDLEEWNDLKTDMLKPGQTLRIR